MNKLNDQIGALLRQQLLPSGRWARLELTLRGRVRGLPAGLTRALHRLVVARCKQVYCAPQIHSPDAVCAYCGAEQATSAPLKLYVVKLVDGSEHWVQGYTQEHARDQLIHGRSGFSLMVALARPGTAARKVHPANIVSCHEVSDGGTADRVSVKP